jgi:hypothetical protein
MEVPMTMHDHHHITEAEDVAFDATMKMVGNGYSVGYDRRHGVGVFLLISRARCEAGSLAHHTSGCREVR